MDIMPFIVTFEKICNILTKYLPDYSGRDSPVIFFYISQVVPHHLNYSLISL